MASRSKRTRAKLTNGPKVCDRSGPTSSASSSAGGWPSDAGGGISRHAPPPDEGGPLCKTMRHWPHPTDPVVRVMVAADGDPARLAGAGQPALLLPCGAVPVAGLRCRVLGPDPRPARRAGAGPGLHLPGQTRPSQAFGRSGIPAAAAAGNGCGGQAPANWRPVWTPAFPASPDAGISRSPGVKFLTGHSIRPAFSCRNRMIRDRDCSKRSPR